MSKNIVVKEKNGQLHFTDIYPEWLGNSASLSLELILQVGETEFRSDVATINLQRGSSTPRDAFGLLLGKTEPVDGGKLVVLSKWALVDDFGNLRIVAETFDPSQFESLQLVVLPILGDAEDSWHLLFLLLSF